MRNKIKSASYIMMTVFIILFGFNAANAAVGNNCTASSSASFNFNVQPAITITAINPVLQNLCPGCSRSWACGTGPFIEWDITGSQECRFDFTGGRLVHCVGDNNASIRGCWMQLQALPNVYEDFGFDNPRTFFNNSGQGVYAFRFYLTSQAANCNASGNYCWCIDASVNYVCGFDQEILVICPTCPPPL